jgi:hypothetical protein
MSNFQLLRRLRRFLDHFFLLQLFQLRRADTTLIEQNGRGGQTSVIVILCDAQLFVFRRGGLR